MARPNLADATFEPSDEELVELADRAFAEVPARHREITEKLRSEIRLSRVMRARSNGSAR